MRKKRFHRKHRGSASGTSKNASKGVGARAETPRPPRPAAGPQASVPPRVIPAKQAPAPPPPRSEEGREGKLDVVESTNGEHNGESNLPAGSAGEGIVAEKIAFGGGEIVIYRRVERKSCSRYMLKDMFD